MAEADLVEAETQKLLAEERKLLFEALKLKRDRALAPWVVAISGMTAGAALMGAGVLLGRFLTGVPL